MKKVQKLRLIASILLIAFVSTVVSYVAFAGNLIEAHQVQTIAVRCSAILLAVGVIKGLLNLKASQGLLFSDGFVMSDTSYAGEVAAQFFLKSLTKNDTVAGGHIYVKDGIKKKFTIPRWDANYEDLIQDRKATPTSKGSMDITGQVLEPQDYMIYMEFNPRDFEDHWFATQLNETLIDRSLPYSVESVVVQGVLARHAKYLNKAIWNNDKSLAAPSIYRYFDGIVTRSTASSTNIDVPSPTTLSKTNIVAELKKGYDLIPDALKYDPSMKIFMNYKTYNFYDEAQKDQANKGPDFTEKGRDTFYGLPVVKIADMPDNCYLIAKGMATPESNLWLGLNSISDEGLQLEKLQKNSELWFIKMLMKVDFNFGWDEETVFYKA
jgi:hypothetical protein